VFVGNAVAGGTKEDHKNVAEMRSLAEWGGDDTKTSGAWKMSPSSRKKRRRANQRTTKIQARH